MLLEGRTVFVTGAGRGMGRGIAEALAEAGAAVGLGDLALEPVQETARLVEARGGRAVAMPLDVTDGGSVEAAIARTAGAFGALDGWVNNAGILRMGPALETTAADWDAQMRVNVSALFLCCQKAARRFAAHGGGAIVNVASNAGKVGYPNMAAYNAGKAAVIGLTRSLAAEWSRHGVNVNAVCPGGVDTPMLDEVARWIAHREGGEATELRARMTPAQMGRHIQPVEVGRVVAFLLSPHAAIIRGQSINVDGGDTPY
ncbi:MAG TPA: SDR family NAD(P)-dependent oxidoreductase [Vicinamibacteria bacterium]|nr:SDR family NAD(P)-dependent oxidoreductase [Vicinamibacteria bacterium]